MFIIIKSLTLSTCFFAFCLFSTKLTWYFRYYCS